jgi:hypothetical protein
MVELCFFDYGADGEREIYLTPSKIDTDDVVGLYFFSLKINGGNIERQR